MSGTYSYTPYIWPMLVSAIFSAWLAVYARRFRAVPGATSFSVQVLFVALWALFTAIEMAAPPSARPLYYKLQVMAGLASESAMLYFALQRATSGKRATRQTARLLALLTLCLIILLATDDFNHLVYTRMWFDGWVRIERGPLNFLILGSGLLLPLVALFLFLRLWLRSRGIYRLQALMLIAGAALPLLTYMMKPAGINPVAPLDPVILVFNVSELFWLTAIVRFRMLEVVPIGRHTAIERLASGVLILDTQNRIVDLNPAAMKVLALPSGTTIGFPAAEALAAYPELVKFVEQETDASAEMTLGEPGQPRYFQAQASFLSHPAGFDLGRLILLQDVTDQHEAQVQLLARQWAQATRQEREQLAQELHDGLSQSLAFLNVQAQAAELLLCTAQPEAARANLARLSETARQVQDDMRELIGNLLTVSLPSESFCATLRQIAARFEAQNGLAVRLDMDDCDEVVRGPTRLSLDAGVQLVRIVQEALTNVRKHAGRPDQIAVHLRVEDRLLCLAVVDSGAGFDLSLPANDGQHFGLQVMRQRAAHIGAQLEVYSAPGQGTRIEVCVPLGGDAALQGGAAHTTLQRPPEELHAHPAG